MYLSRKRIKMLITLVHFNNLTYIIHKMLLLLLLLTHPIFFLFTASYFSSNTRTLCGTPEYIAPEVLAQKPYTFPVDMWAVGVITYVLLSGKLPFYSDNNARLFRLILKVTYSYEPQVNFHFFCCINE